MMHGWDAQPLGRGGFAVKKTYRKPVLVKRELLSAVTAAPAASGR
ncbi:hypothetical protein [Mesorhizobium erdmanii]|nr:hypothetical protein [Mesorhizobium erdmanii]